VLTKEFRPDHEDARESNSVWVFLCTTTTPQCPSFRAVGRITSDVFDFQSLVASLVLTRLDYGNANLAVISVRLTNRLQSVFNAAARTIVGLRRRDHISQTLADLHWLRVAERIDLKLAVTVYRCLHDSAPIYPSRDICRTSSQGRRHGFSSGGGQFSYQPRPPAHCPPSTPPPPLPSPPPPISPFGSF
jgi:hypothetical protein